MAARFVPAADEVWRLQQDSGPECELFRKIAEQGHYAGGPMSSTRQGIYATTPSGILLASVNTRDATGIIRMLETALQRWEEIPEKDRYLDARLVNEAPLRQRREALYPEDGLVLRVNSRDLPRDAADSTRRGRQRRRGSPDAWNQNYAWFRRAEARSLLPADLTVGATATVPGALVRRLARLHLVDDVRGQAASYADRDVQRAELSTRVVLIDENRVMLGLWGRTRSVSRGLPIPRDAAEHPRPEDLERGIELTLLGTAIFDAAAARFVHFELVAMGTRWGGAKHNGRSRDLRRNGIGFVLTLAGDDERVAPAAIKQYGWR